MCFRDCRKAEGGIILSRGAGVAGNCKLSKVGSGLQEKKTGFSPLSISTKTSFLDAQMYFINVFLMVACLVMMSV